MTDEERASQVASPTLAPSKTDGTVLKDPATLTAAKRKLSTFFTPEIMQGVREAQEKRANMNKEERSIEIEKTRLRLGMLPIAIVRQMKADDIKRAERAKQRANTSRPSGNDNDAAVHEPLEIDNDTDENENDSNNDNREDNLFSNDSNDDNDKGGYTDPNDNNPGDNSDPDNDYTQSTDDEQTKKKNRSKRKNPHKCHPDSQKFSLGMPENT